MIYKHIHHGLVILFGDLYNASRSSVALVLTTRRPRLILRLRSQDQASCHVFLVSRPLEVVFLLASLSRNSPVLHTRASYSKVWASKETTTGYS